MMPVGDFEPSELPFKGGRGRYKRDIILARGLTHNESGARLRGFNSCHFQLLSAFCHFRKDGHDPIGRHFDETG